MSRIFVRRIQLWVAVLCCLLGAFQVCAANPGESAAFNAAERAFSTTVWDRAEALFAEFVKTFADSPRVPEAILFQAQARYKQANYAGAIELLSATLPAAGKWADQYVYWQAQSLFKKGDHRLAADTFAKVLHDFPASTVRLESSVGEAAARAQLGEWPAVVALLSKPDGVFHLAALTNAANELVPRGYLLLGEAQFAQKDYPAAEATLKPLGTLLLNPTLSWEWQYLMCRIQLASGRREEALQSTANLISLATNAAQPAMQSESVAFKAGLLESLGRMDQAIEAYKDNLAAGLPVDRQRQALLKITELSLAQNKLESAAQTLEKFLAQYTNAPASDLALLTLGELRLRQHVSGVQTNRPEPAGTNAPPATNLLQQAHQAFESLTTRFPQSALAGKGYLNLGWCFSLEGKLPDAQKAFQAAVERLPLSADLATAHFKLGDAEFQQQDFVGAITNYNALIEKFAAVSEIKSNLFEPALYQLTRAALAATNLPVATNAVQKLLVSFPGGFHADRALLLTGQTVGKKGNPAEARQMFLEFVKVAPQAALLPEVRLAIARTYEQEEKWVEAIEQYDGWVTSYTNHPTRPRAEYCRAWANYQARRETNALNLFTNFVTQFPTNEFTPLAQLWVAEHHFRAGDFKNAELSYQSLFQNTNWASSELSYQAQMMAGRVAAARQGWADAIRYFTNLTSNPNCPVDLRVQAMFAYGDTLMSLPDPANTNRGGNYREAIRIFQNICQSYPTNRLTVLAWGEMANCYLQWVQSSRQSELGTNVLYDFQQVINSPLADAAARSIAKVGLATALERQAEPKTGAERTALLELALNHYLDVFHEKILREGEKSDVFWLKKAGWEAGRVAELLERWQVAKSIYEQLRELLPPLRPRLDKNILRVQERTQANGGAL